MFTSPLAPLREPTPEELQSQVTDLRHIETPEFFSEAISCLEASDGPSLTVSMRWLIDMDEKDLEEGEGKEVDIANEEHQDGIDQTGINVMNGRELFGEGTPVFCSCFCFFFVFEEKDETSFYF